MNKAVVLLLLGALTGVGLPVGAIAEETQTEESVCIDDRDALLALDYWTFDQDPEIGVRSVAAIEGCELAAADLISEFHRRQRARGEPVVIDYNNQEVTLSENGEMSILYWHEGQIRAFEGQTTQAVALFQNSFKPEVRNVGAWNEYARATIAFLENDLDELKRQRSLMTNVENISAINLGVVDGLIACFGDSYSHAYGSEECNRRPK